ncbi:hypothetical protein MPDQ_003207 [Monascus purpureus]|uniref:Uncharacterized protein n=1 Tax=Monascus purpureus TaxID=5098 RepID=A0A507QN76_MONPU|nr:hypothetical protein MPDQ_003207 [Monascus purpureus]BDD56873.1 hypothetical protein MAP00_002290 [Monascus purpureus]
MRFSLAVVGYVLSSLSISHAVPFTHLPGVSHALGRRQSQTFPIIAPPATSSPVAAAETTAIPLVSTPLAAAELIARPLGSAPPAVESVSALPVSFSPAAAIRLISTPLAPPETVAASPPSSAPAPVITAAERVASTPPAAERVASTPPATERVASTPPATTSETAAAEITRTVTITESAAPATVTVTHSFFPNITSCPLNVSTVTSGPAEHFVLPKRRMKWAATDDSPGGDFLGKRRNVKVAIPARAG